MGLKDTWNNFKAEQKRNREERREVNEARRSAEHESRLRYAKTEGHARAKYDMESNLKSYKSKRENSFGLGITRPPKRSSGSDMLGGFMGLDFGGSPKPHHRKKKSHKGKKKVVVWV